ncbi:hypothetical protein Tco_0370207 [Tanacetum coccineum]
MGLWYPKDTVLNNYFFHYLLTWAVRFTVKSTSGGIQFLGGDKLVSWSSKKQDCTSMSSAEAEQPLPSRAISLALSLQAHRWGSLLALKCLVWFMKYYANVRRTVADFSHAPLNEYSPSPDDKKQWSLGCWFGGKLIQKLRQKGVYEESFSRHAAWIGGKLIQFMHTTMVPVQVKTMKIQAGIQVSRPRELTRQLQLWKCFGRLYFFAQILDIPCQGACVFTDKWSLDELAYGVPMDGPYQTNPPSPDDINSHELSNESYVLYDRVMNPLTAHQERKTRKDHGTIRGRHSTSSSFAFDQPSSSHLNDDDDGNGEGTSLASIPSSICFVNSLTNDIP